MRANQKITMIYATVVPKVGFVNPFGTTICNVNHINARPQPRLAAAATQERSNCLGCQGCLVYFLVLDPLALQDVRCFSIALRIVTNLCIHAVRATFLSFPAASSR